jgi:hypothetical protein
VTGIGITALTREIQIWQFGYISPQHIPRQGFIIDDQALQYSVLVWLHDFSLPLLL